MLRNMMVVIIVTETKKEKLKLNIWLYGFISIEN